LFSSVKYPKHSLNGEMKPLRRRCRGMTVGKVKDLHSARIITLGRVAVVDTSAGTNPPQMNALDAGGADGDD